MANLEKDGRRKRSRQAHGRIFVGFLCSAAVHQKIRLQAARDDVLISHLLERLIQAGWKYEQMEAQRAQRAAPERMRT